jgi:hypothetical protein
MTLRAEPHGDSSGDTDIRQEPHSALLRGMNLLLREPRYVLERLPDVLPLQIRIVRENLLGGRPVRELANDHRDGNPHATDAGSSAHDLGVEGDSLEHRQHLLQLF